jgi:hypothetical protein
VDDASDVLALADAMNWMIEQESKYNRMRDQARAKAHKDGSKPAFESKMQALVAPLMR